MTPPTTDTPLNDAALAEMTKWANTQVASYRGNRVLALIAELRRLRAANESLDITCNAHVMVIEEMRAELATAVEVGEMRLHVIGVRTAEVEALREDGARLDWLQEQQPFWWCDTGILSTEIRGAKLDRGDEATVRAAIDAARSREEK